MELAAGHRLGPYQIIAPPGLVRLLERCLAKRRENRAAETARRALARLEHRSG